MDVCHVCLGVSQVVRLFNGVIGSNNVTNLGRGSNVYTKCIDKKFYPRRYVQHGKQFGAEMLAVMTADQARSAGHHPARQALQCHNTQNFVAIKSTSRGINSFGSMATILDFPLSASSRSDFLSSIVLLGPKT